MNIIKHIFVLPRRRIAPASLVSTESPQVWRRTEVISYVIQAVFSIFQFGVIGLASWYAYDQWKGDNFEAIEQAWNSREMQIHRDRANDAFVCTALRNDGADLLKSMQISSENHANDVFFYRTLWESARPRSASKYELSYQGLDETIYAMQDFSDRVRKCVSVGACTASNVCMAYGEFLHGFDLTFKLRYRDYDHIYNGDESPENLKWSAPIRKFLNLCVKNNVNYLKKDEYVLNQEESDEAQKDAFKSLSLVKNDKNLVRAWKARACAKMNKTVAEEIADAK